MHIRNFIIAFMIVIGMNAQKIIIIEHLDSITSSRNGKLQKVPINLMEITGVYNGKDLFIKNSFAPDGIGFCVNEVKVNNVITTDEINSSIFRIKLDLFKLKLNSLLKIYIYYMDDCMAHPPLLMNPTVVKPEKPSEKNVLLIEGTNNSQNLYAVNPRSGKNYGITEILVNGKKVDEIERDVVDINFFQMGFKHEEKIKIEFKYEKGCDPFMINPEVINY
ncbi:MAG: hypothetical protein AB7O73_04525 [Bacteroidia bacterium]